MCAKYKFEKPNDRRALDLMNSAAKAVVTDLPDITLAYGVSDEYRWVLLDTLNLCTQEDLSYLFKGCSFIFHKSTELFERRGSKLVSTVVSTFTANYVFSWSTFFPDTPLSFPLPTFDGRAVCYPTVSNLRDYLSWRQADCELHVSLNLSGID